MGLRERSAVLAFSGATCGAAQAARALAKYPVGPQTHLQPVFVRTGFPPSWPERLCRLMLDWLGRPGSIESERQDSTERTHD